MRVNPLAVAWDFLIGGPRVGGAQLDRYSHWQRLPRAPVGMPHSRLRYVVIDTETTGLDMRRDHLIAIGAAAIRRGKLPLSDCFEIVLRQEKASADENILIHGIGGQRQTGGMEPRAAMLDFLEYLGKDPLVAFRAEFDREVVERAMHSILGLRFRHPWIDLAFLLPALFPGTECRTLDDWLAHFGLAGGERHHAVADAFATAMLFQVALAAAVKEKMGTGARLLAMQKAQLWLGKRA
jgi:DNA polymerase III subunit epsilon